MRWFFSMILGVVLLSAAAPGAAQGQLPPNVVELYRAYQEAEAAGDNAATLVAARAVFEAADDADIDPASLATLAENLGYHAAATGDFELALSSLREAAEISADYDEVDLVTGWRWHQAASAALRLDEVDDMLDHAERAVAAFQNDPEILETRPALYGDAHYLIAEAWYRKGRYRRIGEPALIAIEAYDLVQRDADEAYGRAFFFAGLTAFMRRDYEDARVYMHLASDTLQLAGGRQEDIDHAHGLSTVARMLSDNPRPALIGSSRLAMTSEREEEAFAGNVEDRLEAHRFHIATDEREDESESGLPEGAVPAERTGEATISYPEGALQRGIEGVVVVQFAVSESGEVESPEIRLALPSGVFEDAALEGLGTVRYQPATLDGEPVRQEKAVIQFNFEVEFGGYR